MNKGGGHEKEVLKIIQRINFHVLGKGRHDRKLGKKRQFPAGVVGSIFFKMDR